MDSSSKIKKSFFQDENAKVVENLTGIISTYLTMNLEDLFHFLSNTWNLSYFSSLWTVHQILKKKYFLDEKIKVVENLTGNIFYTWRICFWLYTNFLREKFWWMCYFGQIWHFFALRCKRLFSKTCKTPKTAENRDTIKTKVVELGILFHMHPFKIEKKTKKIDFFYQNDIEKKFRRKKNQKSSLIIEMTGSISRLRLWTLF